VYSDVTCKAEAAAQSSTFGFCHPKMAITKKPKELDYKPSHLEE
jgi:hypothetical protein